VTSDEERARKRDSREGRGKREGRRREERVGEGNGDRFSSGFSLPWESVTLVW
jgi:hypothetical protein